jgi:hypothetical protein
MAPDSALEVDEPGDLAAVSALLAARGRRP